MTLVLLTGGTASASASPVQPGVSPAAACGDGPYSGGYYYDSSYNNPHACTKCQLEGARLEATGNWFAYCKKRYNPAGTLTRVDLLIYCRVCRSGQAARIEHP
ncbi:hypothetical protein [Nonomuraea sp. NPDC049709]|uniref:hypothetical protein n=1 Tax=Nonomuraea sp. NPDC049709 TaxID=3154736 RepID=UPI003445F26E